MEVETEEQSWVITVHVHGDATQRVKWLAHVGIAKWDEEHLQGWRRLGVPTSVRAHAKGGPEIDMGSTIKDVLQNGDEIYVNTSLQPSDTR